MVFNFQHWKAVGGWAKALPMRTARKADPRTHRWLAVGNRISNACLNVSYLILLLLECWEMWRAETPFRAANPRKRIKQSSALTQDESSFPLIIKYLLSSFISKRAALFQFNSVWEMHHNIIKGPKMQYLMSEWQMLQLGRQDCFSPK